MMINSLRILMLTPQVPYPAHQGTSLRNYHIIRGLSRHHAVTLLTFVEGKQRTDEAAIRPLLNNLADIHAVPAPARSTGERLRQLITTRLPDMAHRLASDAFAQKLRQLVADSAFDIVQIEGIELARYLPVIRVAKNTKLIFDNHNAETALQRRNMLTDLGIPRRWPAAAYSWVQVGRLRRFERWACQKADGVVAVSATDAALLRPFRGQHYPPIAVIPNSIDVASYQQIAQHDESQTAFDLVFTGKMDYRPNVDAVLWFADKIWPHIRAERPETTWAIVGQKPHARLDRLRNDFGITITGWVEAVQPYLAQAGVVVMPFRVGSGTRLKIIESMAAGKAIVSTAIGAEGFPVTSGQELIVADDPARFAEAVVALLADPVKRDMLGETAVAFAARYDWRNVIPAFEELYTQVLAA